MERCASCGLVATSTAGAQLRATYGGPDGTVAGIAGLATCGSVWCCPVCSAKVLSRRCEDVEGAVTRWIAGGGSVSMLTLTMRHRKGQRLATLWNGMSDAWRLLGKSYGWKAARRLLGVAHTLRVTEVTYGRHGWHVHIHVLWFLTPDLVDAEPLLDQVRSLVLPEWADALDARGFTMVPAAQDLKVFHGESQAVARLGEYLTKNTFDPARAVALEATRSDLKTGRGESRTPFEVLSDVLAGLEAGGGDLDAVGADLAVWHEWEAGSKGRRAHVWSRGAKAALGLVAVDQTDDEIAGEEVGTDADALLNLPARTIRVVSRDSDLMCDLLDAVEDTLTPDAGREVARTILRARGLPWDDPLP